MTEVIEDKPYVCIHSHCNNIVKWGPPGQEDVQCETCQSLPADIDLDHNATNKRHYDDFRRLIKNVRLCRVCIEEDCICSLCESCNTRTPVSVRRANGQVCMSCGGRLYDLDTCRAMEEDRRYDEGRDMLEHEEEEYDEERDPDY